MLKLIESGDKNTFFKRFSYSNETSSYCKFDFPEGLIVYYDNNTWEIFGTTPCGNSTAGCGCCSDYYDENYFAFPNITYWELYEVTPPAIDLASTT